MTWASPLWLLGLLPWSALVLYLLWGRRRRTDVPFLDLWQGGVEGVRVRRRVSAPPLALALAILALLLAILAAGGPAVRVKGPGGGGTVSVIIDRGYTMSARGAEGTRLLGLFKQIQPQLAGLLPEGARVERWVVPGPQAQTTNLPDLIGDPVTAGTAVDTRNLLRAATRAALARNAGPVIVLSDHHLVFEDARVIQVSPDQPVRNARVVLVAARESPAVQVMVRVRGAAGIPRGTVGVISEGARVERAVELSPDRDTDVFIDVPRIGAFLKAELRVVDDDHPADDTAWLVREASWPRLEARAPLPPHVDRMVDVYGRQRPAKESSRRLILARMEEELPRGEPGVVIKQSAAGGRTTSFATPEVRDHPITRGVSWEDVGAAEVADAGPPAGWQPVVSAGGKVWVAVREQPARAVWVGFETLQWARSPDFVLFCAQVFDWAGAGGERFAAYPVGSLEGAWQAVELAGSIGTPESGLWPGLYRRGDGTLRALHAPDVPFPKSQHTDWAERLNRLADEGPGRRPLAHLLALFSVTCLALAALVWRRRNLTVFSVPRSF